MHHRIALIGFDGATFDVIKPLAAKGLLPNLQKFMDHGAWCPLFSTVPALSPVAWTTMVTGVNPGRHGIFDFLVSKRDLHEKAMHFNCGGDRRFPSLWSHLATQNKSSVVINVPMSFPPDKIPGVIVSGMDTPSKDAPFVHPETARQALFAAAPQYIIEPPILPIHHRDPKRFIADLIRAEKQRLRVGLHFLAQIEWDFFMLVFTSLDRVQHVYMRQFDFDRSEEALRLDPVLAIYMHLDTCLGRIMNELPSSTSVFVASDHGFGPVDRQFSVNAWLLREGYIRLQPGSDSSWSELYNKATTSMRKINKKIHARLGLEKNMGFFENMTGKSVLQNVDWAKTTAYCLGSAPSIYINEAACSSTRRATLTRELTHKLSSLVDDRGGRIFQSIHLAKDVYHGPCTSDAPDIIAEMAPGWEYTQTALHGYERLYKTNPVSKLRRQEGNHLPEGVLLAKGPMIQSSALSCARIEDVAPTIYHGLGCPPPAPLDGRILTEILAHPYQCAPQAATENHSPQTHMAYVYSEEEQQAIEDRLKNLGYL